MKDKKAWPWLWLSVAIIVIDQISKYLLNRHLIFNQPVKLLPFFNLTLRYNAGTAFGFFGRAGGWQVYIFSAISLIVAIIFIIWLFRIPRRDWLMGLAISLIIGGAIGNVIDRIRLSYVIDFFDFHIGSWHFATFNVADSAISIGAVLLIIRLLFGSKIAP